VAPQTVPVAGLLLAAGAGRRLGTPKGLIRDRDGTPWVVRAVRALLDGGCGDVVVVVGAEAERVTALVPEPARVVHAADWTEGLGASLRAGLAELDRGTAVAALITLVDLPGVTAAVVHRMVAVAGTDRLARAVHRDGPGHPVLLGRRHWAGVRNSARAETGARDYLTGREVQAVDCTGLGHGHDVDTPEDLLRAGVSGVSPLGEPGGRLPAYPEAVTEPTSPGPAADGQGPPPAVPGAGRPPGPPAHLSSGKVPGVSPVAAPEARPDGTATRTPARRIAFTALSGHPLDVAAHEAAVADPAAGAVVTFSGAVRNHDRGRAVTGIEYVAHPSAETVLAEIVGEVVAGSGCEAAAVTHRTGELGTGEAAIVVAVSSAHRQEAFNTASVLVDEVKQRLPVWKRQRFADGTEEWVACP
jgi:molybdopterin synthase catalytic subunit/CTP:molybdopterin cytidylyltransferase MocA